MRTLERLDFQNEYGISPSRVMKLKEGEYLTIKKKDGIRFLKCVAVKGNAYNPSSIILSENGENFVLDLCPHWERGGDVDFELCHEGIVNLINGIYAQTEADYEQFFLAGVEGYKMDKNIGESRKDFEIRRRAAFDKSMKDCEEILGEVFVKYAKIKALWKITHDVNVIAEKLGETPYHISCIVSRLGLNQP